MNLNNSSIYELPNQVYKSLNQSKFIEINQKPPVITPEKDSLYECISVFDSTFGSASSGGYVFRIPQPHPSIIGFKFTGATVFNNAVPNTHQLCYITCDLVMNSFPGYINNYHSQVIAMIPLTTPGPVNLYSINFPKVTSGVKTNGEIKFELRDRQNRIIKDIPFIVTLTLYIAK